MRILSQLHTVTLFSFSALIGNISAIALQPSLKLLGLLQNETVPSFHSANDSQTVPNAEPLVPFCPSTDDA